MKQFSRYFPLCLSTSLSHSLSIRIGERLPIFNLLFLATSPYTPLDYSTPPTLLIIRLTFLALVFWSLLVIQTRSWLINVLVF